MGDHYTAKCIYGFTLSNEDRNLIKAIPKQKYYNELETWIKNSVQRTMSGLGFTYVPSSFKLELEEILK